MPESLEYYVEAGGVRSKTYKLNVVDLPSVKNIKVTYHYPAWTGMKDMVEDPGGDLRAVEGTTAEVAIQTDRPLANGALLLDDGIEDCRCASGPGRHADRQRADPEGRHVSRGRGRRAAKTCASARTTSSKRRRTTRRRCKITRPGRDFKASPIEEVTVAVEAKDDFGLKDVELHYSVNGGAGEDRVAAARRRASRPPPGSATIALEDFKVQPGDVVSIYATAKDARTTTNTDMFFIQAEPFERNYTQSQQEGGGGGGGGGEQDGDQQQQISQRQKEIITATWNQIKGRGARSTDAENAAFLAQVQSKLRDQAKSLADRMKARAD